MNDDGTKKTLYPYSVRIRGCAGDLIVCGLVSVTAKQSGCALAVVNCNPCGLGFKVKKEIRLHAVTSSRLVNSLIRLHNSRRLTGGIVSVLNFMASF